jgi:hypothetical protein
MIHDLHIAGIPVAPSEADSPAIVDPDAVLAPPVTPQCFHADVEKATGEALAALQKA